MVETHLTKIYRELGIKQRGQLAATIAGRASGETGNDGVTKAGRVS